MPSTAWGIECKNGGAGVEVEKKGCGRSLDPIVEWECRVVLVSVHLIVLPSVPGLTIKYKTLSMNNLYSFFLF